MFNLDKFANAVLLVLNESPSPPGLTVLLKVLFRSDFAHYQEHLRSITGVEYVALERGPVPHDYRSLLQKLASRGDVVAERVDVASGYKPMECYRALRRPDLAAFDPSELAVLRAVIAADAGKTGKQLSDETHAELPWRAVWRDGEGESAQIPYALSRWEENRCNAADLTQAANELQRTDVQAVIAQLVRPTG
jgi:hypothetical protein